MIATSFSLRWACVRPTCDIFYPLVRWTGVGISFHVSDHSKTQVNTFLKNFRGDYANHSYFIIYLHMLEIHEMRRQLYWSSRQGDSWEKTCWWSLAIYAIVSSVHVILLPPRARIRHISDQKTTVRNPGGLLLCYIDFSLSRRSNKPTYVSYSNDKRRREIVVLIKTVVLFFFFFLYRLVLLRSAFFFFFVVLAFSGSSWADKIASSRRMELLQVRCPRQCWRAWGASTSCAGTQKGVGEERRRVRQGGISWLESALLCDTLIHLLVSGTRFFPSVGGAGGESIVPILMLCSWF